jgi:flagellar biosynthesis/type III secretory pathway chaperone
MIGLHRHLHDLCRLERESLVSADVKAIQEHASAKSALVENIKQQESERLRLSLELALEWKRPVKELTLSTIIAEIEPRDAKMAEALRSSFNALKILIERTRAVNDANRGLIERSLEHVHSMKKNVLGEAVPRADTYGSTGQKVPKTGGARLLSKEI